MVEVVSSTNSRAKYRTVSNMEIILKEGQTICGFDFGKVRNQIVACKIIIDSSVDGGFRILFWDMLDFGRVPLRIIIEQLIDQELQSPCLEGDWFLLESQPMQNAYCVALSHCLQARLLSNSFCVRAEPSHIFFVRATRKFRILDYSRKFKPTHLKSPYATRKQWAVRLARHFTESQESIACQKFNSHKKKDDLADAFCYAYSFYREHRHTLSTD